MTAPKPNRAQARGHVSAWPVGPWALACALLIPLVAGMSPPVRAGEGADPASLLESLREKQRLKDQQAGQRFQTLLQQGRALMAQHDYGQAAQVLAGASRLRPTDEACASLLAQATAAAAPAPTLAKADESEKLLNKMRQQQGIKETALQRQLEMSLFEAGKAQKAGDHALAREHAERVVQGLPYLADKSVVREYQTRAEGILASAGSAAERSATAELQDAIASAKAVSVRERAATLTTLRERGWKFMEMGQHEKALEVAAEMLSRDPGNAQALYLRGEAQRAIGDRNDIKTLTSRRKDAAKRALGEAIAAEMKPPKDLHARVVLAGNRVTKSGETLREQAMEPWERELRRKLRGPVDVEFQNASITEASRYLSLASQCTILVDPVVARETRRISLPKMPGMQLEHVLRWLCRFCKVNYTLRDHAILITSRGGLLDQPITRDYSLSDLLIPTDRIRPSTGRSAHFDTVANGHEMLGTGRSASEPSNPAPQEGDAMGLSWVAFIRSSIAPDSWDSPVNGEVAQEKQQYTIQYRNGRIVVVHTPEVHEQVERLLDDFRKSRNLQVHIFARILTVSSEFLQSFDLDLGDENNYGFDSDPNGTSTDRWHVAGTLVNDDQTTNPVSTLDKTIGPLTLSVAHLGNTGVNALLSAVLKRRKGSILVAPRLTCFNTQRANFQAVTNYNYVRRIAADGMPEIGNVPDGIIFDIQPFVSADRRYITLVLQPQLRSLVDKDFQSKSFWFSGIPDDPNDPGAIDQLIDTPLRVVNLPETYLWSVATTVTIPDGGTLLIGGLSKVYERSGESGVPFLNSIPFLKFFFRAWTDTDYRDSVLFLVSAEIVPDIYEE